MELFNSTLNTTVISARLLSWGSDDETYAPKFAAEAFEANPKCQVLVYTIWPDANMDWAQPPEIRTERHTEKVADAVAKAFPQALKPKVVPSSLLIREIGRLADRGEIPGMKSRFEVLRRWSPLLPRTICGERHGLLDALRRVAIGLSRFDHPLRQERQTAERPLCVRGRAAGNLQGLAPDHRGHPDHLSAGRDEAAVGDRGSLAPDGRRRPAIPAELKLLNGQGPIQWTLSAGNLPGGLALSERGLLEGTTEQIGTSSLVLRAKDGNGTVERALRLEVAVDKPLAIQALDFGKVGLDEYVLKELKTDGGVGHKTWTVTAGQLPYGLRVLSSGMLDGTPGEAGEFSFTVRATDSHPAGSRTAERAIKVTVGPAAPDTLLVRKVPAKAVTEDAAITEPFWNFDQSVAAKMDGQPIKKAAFSVVWEEEIDPKRANKPPAGRGLWLVVKVMDGPAGQSKKDGVHVYVDGRHNREVIYNADDMHFFIPRHQRQGAWAPVVRGMRANWFTKAFVQEFAGGYCVKVFLSGSHYFGGEGNWLPFGPKGVYGFDVAVEEEAGRQVWRGNGKIDEDTSHFGSIVLSDETVTK